MYDYPNTFSINANVHLVSPFFCFPTLIITTNVTRVNMIDDSFGGDAAVVEYDVLIDFHTFLVGFVEAGMTLECAVA